MSRGALRLAPALVLAAACASSRGEGPADAAADDGAEALSGGRATVFDTSRMAFAQAVPGLAGEREDEFFVGNAIFNRSWITAPASVADFDGLGPVFNATSCSTCHPRDGRGRPPEGDEAFGSMLLRLSVAGVDAHGGTLPDPVYGGQLQGSAIPGVRAEGREVVEYIEVVRELPDGERYSLRAPRYRVEGLAYGPLAPDVLVSPRVGPPMHGLGLLAALTDAVILEAADPEDRDHDGISGRPNRVWDVRRGMRVIGRFGWKANQPTLEQQVAGAFNGDLGITSSMFPSGDCSSAQLECVASRDGGAPEISEALLASVVTYAHLLAVPARRHWREPDVRRGKELFAATGCAKCHRESLTTGPSPASPELAAQTIHPYTDLLLHDMGAELSDGRPDFEAAGNEWRTPPLWGIGLTFTVNRHTNFLHDGRARGLREAILWHGGEGSGARDAFARLPRTDRDAIVAFLESL